MASQSYDVVVVGSGPGGYEAAVHAAQLGKTVACVEKAELGGICLNWGCIPTKTLIHDAHLFHQVVSEAAAWGLSVDKARLQWDKIVGRSRSVAGTLSGQIGFLFKKNKVAHVKGTAFIPRAGVVEVRNDKGELTDTLTAKNILICTGARNRELPGLKPDGKMILTSREAMILKEIPKKLIIIGAGAIGVEFAYIYGEFGTEITIIEMMERILPIEDEEVSTRLEAIFKKRGIKVLTRTKTEKLEVAGDKVKATVSPVAGGTGGPSEVIEADKVLVAIGVTGNVEGLFGAGVTPEIVKGHIKVGKDYQTNIPGIYAAGDVIGPPWLAHVATMEAKIAIERMFGATRREMDYSLVPGCTYCVPQVASVGLTEKQCKEQGLDYEVGKWMFAANGKALAINAPDGFVKLIFEKKYGELLGAHMLGAEVTDMLAELVLAKRLEATKEEIMNTIHAHPTLSEAVMEAAGQAGGHGK
ncbi:MAG TPA: dihydrolipoyl dehydrogenase [Phycisphaerae bacterium]|nr:dihydrolipoyl dehydrogenase [Phycisphaerae bacterium]